MSFLKINSENIRNNLINLRQLIFEVTDNCNLDCKYCAYSDLYQNYDSREGKNISFAMAKQIIDYLHHLRKENYSEGANHDIFISFYGGEPLINIPFIKQVIEYVESLEKIGIVYFYAMTTNAMLLDKYMDFIVKNKIRLLISLDGDEFAHSYREDLSGKNSFSRVFRNINLLQEKHPEYFKNSISFNSVLHNRNDIELIYRFINMHFGKIPKISMLNEVGISETKKDEFKTMFRNPVENFFKLKNYDALESELTIKTPRVSSLADYIQYQSGNFFDTYNDLFIDKDALDFPLTGTCIPFSKRMFITVNGKILPCEKVGHQFSMGQVYDNHVELDEENVANIYNQHVSKYVQQCGSCALKTHCMQCVYQFDDISKEKTRCMEFRTAKELKGRNENIFKFVQAHPYYYRRILEENLFKLTL